MDGVILISEDAEIFLEYFTSNYELYLIEKRNFSIYSGDEVVEFKKDRKVFLDECVKLIKSFSLTDYFNVEVRDDILLFLSKFELLLPGSFRIRVWRRLSEKRREHHL